MIKKSRYSDEQIVRILRQADQIAVVEGAKKHGVSEQTIYPWRKRFGAMMTDDVKRLKALDVGERQAKEDGCRARTLKMRRFLDHAVPLLRGALALASTPR